MAKRSISSVMLNAKVLSVFLAVGLWIYVAGVRGPDTAKSLSADVMAINVPQGYVVSGALPSVTVTLRGPMNALWNVTNEYVTPTADLRGRTEGSSVVPVSVQIAGLSGVTVEQVEPRDVSIYLEKLETVSMAVTAELSGALPSGLVIGSIEIQPSTVLVSGPSSAVSRVRDVSVSIALDRLGILAAGNISVAGDVRAYDAQEQVVTGVHLSPGTVAAILPVADAGTVRTVPILPVVAGRIRPGYALIGVSCTPAVVMVRGEKGVIDALQSLGTLPIDISEDTGSTQHKVGLSVPQGLTVAGGVVEITCQVLVEPVVLLAVPQIQLEIRGAGSGWQTSPEVSSVSMLVTGSNSVVLGLRPSQLHAYVDISVPPRDDGSYPVYIEGLPQGIVSVAVTPEAVIVGIVKEP